MQIVGKNIVRLAEVASTNNYASTQVADKEVEEGTVFLAEAQTAGRGQRNNYWESEPGKNLTFSLVLKPSFLDVMQQYMISKVVALGLTDYLMQQCDKVSIKWPNDIYVGEQKIAGMLIENSILGGKLKESITGVGININQEQFLSDAPNPVSLKQLTGTEYNTEVCLTGILHSVNKWYLLLKDGQFSTIDSLFEERMLGMGHWRRYTDGQTTFEGKIEGVNGIGQLVLTTKEGIKQQFHFKEIEFLLEK